MNLADPGRWQEYDVVLERSLSYKNGLYTTQVLNAWGIPTVNMAAVAATCGDKLATSAALDKAGVPQPRSLAGLYPRSRAGNHGRVGYPVVLKPVVGSWGRLLAKINDREAAEAILEHKEVLGSFQHSVFYIQEYIQKPGRDIRSFVIGDQTVAPSTAARALDHQYRPRRQGRNLPGDPRNRRAQCRAAQAVGGGVVAIDILEDPDRGFLINEVNHTMEFHSTVPLTGVDIPGMIVDYTLEVARNC